MNYDAMLEYVKFKLEKSKAIKPNNPYHQFRDRYEHTRRVYGWMQRILSDCPNCNKNVALTSAIFHDVGYSMGKANHAESSAMIFRDYAEANNFDTDFTNAVSNTIALHSDKDLLNDPSISDELVLLLEADLLDEEGCLGIVWDLLAQGYKGANSYKSGLEALYIHSGHILNQDYMITPLAKEYWEKKKGIVKNFIEELTSDLFLEEV